MVARVKSFPLLLTLIAAANSDAKAVAAGVQFPIPWKKGENPRHQIPRRLQPELQPLFHHGNCKNRRNQKARAPSQRHLLHHLEIPRQ